MYLFATEFECYRAILEAVFALYRYAPKEVRVLTFADVCTFSFPAFKGIEFLLLEVVTLAE